MSQKLCKLASSRQSYSKNKKGASFLKHSVVPAVLQSTLDSSLSPVWSVWSHDLRLVPRQMNPSQVFLECASPCFLWATFSTCSSGWCPSRCGLGMPMIMHRKTAVASIFRWAKFAYSYMYRLYPLSSQPQELVMVRYKAWNAFKKYTFVPIMSVH